ncbi:hypothetical protein KHP62_04410 [Rhodobacteraceae bacterium NNCM2]|nr:hypothetical protein [Coraliihabitans acroporae]
MRRALCRLCLAALALISAPAHGLDQLDLPALMAGQAARASLFDLVEVEGRLVAVGEQGIILTRDAGAGDWQQRQVPVSTTLVAADFNEQGIGLVVGHDGVILRSTDNGASWARVADGRSLFRGVINAAKTRLASAEAELAAARAEGERDTEDLEFIVDEEGFRLETAEQSLEYGPSWPLLDVAFTTDETAWIVGAYGMLFTSADAGENWQLVSDRIDNVEDLHLNALLKTSQGALLIAGEAGLLFRSADGGESFERFDSYDGLSLFGLAEADGFITAYGFGDTVQVSVDDGRNWDSVPLDGDFLLVGDVALADGQVGLLGGSGTMLTLAADGVVASERPTGHRAFLSGGIVMDDGARIFTSEAGISPHSGE